MAELQERDELELRRGKRELFAFRTGELPDGSPVNMPVMVVSGVEDGPTLLVTACVHGNEFLGIGIIRRVIYGVSPNELRGSLVAVPMVNRASVGTRTRRNVSEMYPGPHDMNRIFPGNATGNMADRTAFLLMEKLIKKCDYVFDLHSASIGGEWVPYAGYAPRAACSSDEVYERASGMAHAFGAKLILAGHSTPGSLADAAVSAGVPAGMAEFGVANVVDAEGLELGERGILNVMKYLGMITGAPEVPEPPVVISALHRLTANHAGLLQHLVPLGAEVRRGHTIARTEHLFGAVGDIVEEFQAPADGIVCRRNTMGVVGTGDIVAYVGVVQEGA